MCNFLFNNIIQLNSALDYLRPVINFIIRLYIAKIFWLSGVTKLSSWSKTLWLFTNEYQVPFFSPALAAAMSMSAELCCPILLLLGLGTRFASIALFIMTLVIQFTYDRIEEHYYWMMLLSFIIAYGGDKLSLDYYLKNKFKKKG